MNFEEEIEKLKKEFAVSQAISKNNMKWGGIAIALIISFLGYNSLVSLPSEAKKAAKKEVEERIDQEVSERLGEDIVLKIKNLNKEIDGIKVEAERITEDLKNVLKDLDNEKVVSGLKSIHEKIVSLELDIKNYGVMSVDWAYGSKKKHRIKGKEKSGVIKLQCKEPSAKDFDDNYLYIKRP